MPLALLSRARPIRCDPLLRIVDSSSRRHFAICATAPASWGPEFDEFPELAKQAGLAKEGNATMGWYQSEGGGFVFNAGSTDWVLGLADPAVERITRNVLDAARK